MTKWTAEDSPSVIPHTAITLDAVCISQGTHTGVSAQTFPAVAHPSFTEVTYCPHHGHPSAVDPRMFDDAIWWLHALGFATLSTDRQLLHRVTEVAEGSVLLFSLTFVTIHVKVAGVFGHIYMFPVGSTLFLSLLTTFSLFPGTGFLFGHFCFNGPVATQLTASLTSSYLQTRIHRCCCGSVTTNSWLVYL